ncbi:hypothetical protein SAMN05660860_02414 [Geoalkalibacter ferrihydriticus]|uniref:Uncharacterized protein n=2 Tax=Geoalkalibacter ferrihydriticus TaxID=392333 RepID=A0A0C2HSZ7_9BACT|nr:hypothetical protein [Geoalkalibacter ferrihydriticus]KIH77935.1 hypothetical protein GFER_04800 [Geoalkalibacter ferrihydriticus DSM 17813]SDM36465.1 hypothetical protein SAMN05660860_02414 [Geoalkalibacter ferrihydriticus]
MTAILIVLTVVAYLALLVDWKDLIGVLGQGGWVSIVLYVVLTAFIVVILTNPDIPHIVPH